MSQSSSHLPHPTAMSDGWHFFLGFLRQPWKVGAVAPSSARLAQAIVRHCALGKAQTVVELGAGTGAITRQILKHIGPQTTFITLELDAGHVARLRKRHPGLRIYHASAENLRTLLAKHGRGQADCIISGLPWGNMSSRAQHRIMGEVLSVLKPGGRFCGFGYVHASWYPSSRAFRRMLERNFQRVGISPIVWRNLPPAFVYFCA
ncbi:MAG: methyltransferase domain-containing protein [Opitutaceae bacterium]|nr:methyltransferase domain-containing protein [Opitutaceae bacterium]